MEKVDMNYAPLKMFQMFNENKNYLLSLITSIFIHDLTQ